VACVGDPDGALVGGDRARTVSNWDLREEHAGRVGPQHLVKAWFAFNNSSANRARCFAPPSGSDPSPSRTSSDPSTRYPIQPSSKQSLAAARGSTQAGLAGPRRDSIVGWPAAHVHGVDFSPLPGRL